MNRRSYLLLEFLILFVSLPTAIFVFKLHKLFLLILWVFGFLCYLNLKSDKSFDIKNLNRWGAVTRKNLGKMLITFITLGAVLTLYTYHFEHERFLGLIASKPYLWAMIMVLYPLLSVYPQEIIFRAFIFHRYRSLFGEGELMLYVNAFAFGFAHIIFANFLAVSMCFIGGLIFGNNYRKNKSLILVSMDHALYGCLIFTLGLGWYFYHGAH